MSKEQLTLFDTEPFDTKPVYTNSQKRKWTKKYKIHCEKIYHEEGDMNGSYCCGYHWCCNECECKLHNGCADCVHTIKTIAKELGIKINYLDYDFKKIEEEIKKTYYASKGWIAKEELL